MEERPILMTPENAQKCFEGIKTQTRRIVKRTCSGRVSKGGKNWHIDDPDAIKACPYGVVGARLWIREAWAQRGEMKSVIYKGDSVKALGAYGCVKWKPAIHMPRWACRTVVEITEIRVQRVQEISHADAIAEGCYALREWDLGRDDVATPRDQFESLWASINGKGSWDENPWVWALTFKKV